MNPDKDSFEILWKKIIECEMGKYKTAYPNCIHIILNAKEEIWKKYVKLNAYCKTTYMKSPEGRIDRHKVAACYMIAIVTSKPMRFSGISEDIELSLNEMLAITVGLSLVRAFALAEIDGDTKLSSEEKCQKCEKFSKGVKLPESHLVKHGTYLNNYAHELFFTAEEGKISILPIAHELYLLEVITLMS